MKQYQTRNLAFHAAALAILVPVCAAQAGPIDTAPTGAWRADVYGRANVGPSLNGAFGGLEVQLLNEWRPGEMGYDYAAAPIGATKFVSKLTVTDATSFLASIERRFSFLEHDPTDPVGLVSALTGSSSLIVEVNYDDDYFAQVGTYAESNADTDSNASLDSATGADALAEADSTASAPGVTAVVPTVFWQAWAIFSSTKFFVDENPIPIYEEVTQWSRDRNGNVTVVNLTPDLIGPPIHTMDGSFATMVTVPNGTETLIIEQSMWGHLETHVELIPEPGSATLFALGFCGLVCGWRCRHKGRIRR